MRFTVFVDTSAWYALTDTDDARHAQAVNALRQLQASGNRLVTTNHVIGESYTLVLSRLGRRVAQTFLAGMSASRLVERVFVLEAWEQAAESLIFRYLDQ
ncbi:MAG: type II toxin-antitoxin system VapC family toxin, partial [Chloroflexota bacterium]